jgi:AraC-like DNA-binding protein
MDSPERKLFDLRRDGLPQIPSLGWCHYTRARPDLPVHRHFGVLEMHFVEQGRVVFEVDGESFKLHGGDVFITQPGEPHSTGGRPIEPCTLYWMHLRVPKRGGRLLRLPANESAEIAAGLESLPVRQFRGSLLVKTLMDRLLSLHVQPDAPYRATRLRQLAVDLLLEVLDCSARHEAAGGGEVIPQIVAMIRSRPGDEFRLKDLIRKAGFSGTWFMEKFKEEIGMTPRKFIERTRVEAACERLRSADDSVTRIASELGFPNSQYFATVFRRVMGVTPQIYRKQGLPRQRSQRKEDGQF